MTHPHLEYCVQVWASVFIRDVAKLEKLQKVATRCGPGSGWIVSNHITSVKEAAGRSHEDQEQFVFLRELGKLKEHPLTLVKLRVRTIL